MKIVVFGASRGVGLKIVEQALEAGYTVTAFARSPEKFEVKHANLIVFKGDSTDAAAQVSASPKINQNLLIILLVSCLIFWQKM
ncbi:MAG: SDR family NAD(P)-dependent oxidoreductase [Anaerolineales bacterium]